MKKIVLAAAAASILAVSAAAQAPGGMPGAPEVSRVTAGTYEVDTHHTQVIWSVNHLGFSTLYGMFGQITGTLALDPADPNAAKLDVKIPIDGLTVTAPDFNGHLRSPGFFDAEKFPEARFVSTSVKAEGNRATIVGDLTVHGVTKPVTLEATFVGAGQNPMDKKANVGFEATGKVKRSDFGLGAAAPFVSDEVDLKIIGAFAKG